MPRPLSVGAKLGLRYTAAMAITTTVFAWVVYEQVAQRINREATLLLELRLRDLVEAFEEQLGEHPRDHVLRWMAEHAETSIARSEPDLGLGIELLDPTGQTIVSAGSLDGAGLPLPGGMLDGERRTSFRAVNLGGRFAHLTAAEAVDGGFLRVALDTTRYAENVSWIRRIFLVSLPIVLVMTALTGWYLAAQSLRPIAAINATARRIESSNLQELVPVSGSGDELDDLAVTLNEMLGRIQEGVERAHHFNANAAHQLRTPLTALRSEVDVTLERPRSPEEYRKVLADIHDDVERMGEAIDAMLRLARTGAGLAPDQLVPVDVARVVEEVLEFFEPLALESGIELAGSWLPRSVVLGERSWLQQLFGNLLSNAIRHSGRGARVEVSARPRLGGVEVRVADDGPGIGEDAAMPLFQRFGPSEASEGGSGLGLSIAHEIARAHGGRIELESTPGSGAVFRVWLPLAPDADPSATAEAEPA